MGTNSGRFFILRHLVSQVFKVFLYALLVIFFVGCATTDYTTHYGIFTAENSAGEERQFRVYWQVLRYEGWSEDFLRAKPVVIETQCSERELHFYDASFGNGRRCEGAPSEGIHYCGDNQEDTDRRGLPIRDKVLCGSITDRNGSTDILSLEGDILINLNCRPRQTVKQGLEDKKNVDYLLSSEIPYTISTKKVKGDDVELFIPTLSNHSSICDPDG